MKKTEKADLQPFYDLRNNYLPENKKKNLGKLWKSYLQNWALSFPAEHEETLREWKIRVNAREHRETLIRDSIDFATTCNVENPLMCCPSLKSLKSMQKYFCEALETALEHLSHHSSTHVSSGKKPDSREN